MKVGKPISKESVPETHWDHRGKYTPIWEAAKGLKAGQVLPVEFNEKREAQLFQQGSRATGIIHGLRIRIRGKVAYVSHLNGEKEPE